MSRTRRKPSQSKRKFNTGWCFAIVNGRLAEIYFDSQRGIEGHCYVRREEYRTKQEKGWIREDTARYRFVFRNGKYYEAGNKRKHAQKPKGLRSV